jgi:hypothetical protein
MMAHALLTLCGGLLAASAWISAREPRARDIYARVERYRGGFGVLLLVWALLMLVFRYLVALPAWLDAPFDLLVYTASILCDIAIGFLLGFPLLARWLARRQPDAVARAERLRTRLRPFQIVLGGAAIVSGALLLFLSLT